MISNSTKSTFALNRRREGSSSPPCDSSFNQEAKKRSQEARYKQLSQLENHSYQILNQANKSQQSFFQVPNMNFSVSGQKINFGSKTRIDRSKNPSQLKIQRPTTAQVQTSFKLAEGNDPSKELEDKIEDYQRIVQGMDLSFQDNQIPRDEELDGIEEWKASYISNQAMSEFQKKSAEIQKAQQVIKNDREKRRGKQHRSINYSTSNDQANTGLNSRSSPAAQTNEQSRQNIIFQNSNQCSSTQLRALNQKNFFVSKLDDHQLQTNKKYGLQATYQPYHQRISSAGVQNAQKLQGVKKLGKKSQQSSNEPSFSRTNYSRTSKLQQKVKMQSDLMQENPREFRSKSMATQEATMPAQNSVLRNILRSEYMHSAKPSKFEIKETLNQSRDYLSFDRLNPFISQEQRIDLPQNYPQQTGLMPQATRFANNKIMINLRQNGQVDTISGRLSGTVNRDSIRERKTTEEGLATGEERQSQNNQIIPDTVRTFKNPINSVSGGQDSTGAIGNMIYSSNFNSPDYTLMVDKYGSSNFQTQEAKREHASNIESMEDLNISLLKQLKEERRSKQRKSKQRNNFYSNSSLGVKKAKINVVKRQNNARFSAPKIIKVDGMAHNDVTTLKKNGVNTETAMTNSLVPSELSNFRSLEAQMQQQVMNTRIIFQRQFEENLKQERFIKAHIELFAQQQQLAEDLDIKTQVAIVDDMVKMRMGSQIDRVQHQNRQSKQMLKSVNEHNRETHKKRFGAQEDKVNQASKKSSRNSASYGQSKALQNLFKLQDFSEKHNQRAQAIEPHMIKILKNQSASTDLNESKETENRFVSQSTAVEAAIENNDAEKVIDFSKHFKIAEVKSFDPQVHIDKISRSVTPQTRAIMNRELQIWTNDSIIKEARPQKFDMTIHGRPPTSKDKLRYSKFNPYEKEILAEHNANKDDNFKRIPIVSNQVRQIFRPQTELKAQKQKQLMPRPSPMKQRKAKIEMLGNFNIDHKKFKEMASHFDPFRLKVIMMPKAEAVPAGKNPDFFFVQGIDYLNIRDHQTALKNFEKGCMINKNHYLCRFNLGYTLFLLGNFEQAAQQYKILWNQCQGGNHPESRFSFVLYNKAVSELQTGDFTSSARTAGQCVEIMKSIEKKKGGSIVFLTKMERDVILDMLQLEGYSHFRDKPGKADAKATGKCFEAADVRLGILEQEQIDQMNLNIENQPPQMAIESKLVERDNELMGKREDHQLTENKEIEANQSNNQSQTVSQQQLNEKKKSTLYLNLGGTAPNEESSKKVSEIADPDIRELNANSSLRKIEERNTFLADYMKQTVHDGNDSRSKLTLMKQKSSSVSLTRKQTLQKNKRNRSLSLIKAKPFHVEADRVNQALDFNKIIVDDKALKSQKNIKSQADKLYGQISWFMDDFKTRLEASVVAGRQGADEMNAFKHGPPKDGEEQLGSDEEKKAEAKVATKRTNITNRNTQRNKNRNKLEMEVEKDLTNLKKILTKKKQQKKLADKENQQFMLADREQLTKIFQRLHLRKQMSQRQGLSPDQYKYDLEDIEELDDLITKFRAFRTSIEDDRRKFWLQSGHVSYLIMKRGDILYEQGEDSADSQFWIVSGAATIIRSFIDHDLLFKINNEKRVNKAKLDETLLTYSSQHSEEHICHENKGNQASPSPFKVRPFESPDKDLLSNTDDGKILELSEHSSDSILNSHAPGLSEGNLMRKLELKEQALKQLDKAMDESDDFERDDRKHPYEEFLYDLDRLNLTELQTDKTKPQVSSEEQDHTARFENGIPSAYNYVPIDQRPGFKKKEARALSIERKLSLDCKNMAAYRAIMRGPKKGLGVQLKESKLDAYNKQFPKVRVAEKNLGKGMIFGQEIFEWWKNLKFNQRIIDEIEKTITDKIALVKYVKTFQKEKNEKLAKKQEEYLDSLSPVRRATLLQQFSESCLDLIKKSQSSPSPSMMSRRTSFRHLQIHGMSPDTQGNRQRSRSINQTPSPMKQITGLGEQKKRSSQSILESTNKTVEKRKSSEMKTPTLAKQGTKSDLGLQHQDTSMINKNLENYDNAVSKIEKTKMKVQKKIDKFRKGEIDNIEDGPHVPPAGLKRENTCLITEEDTLVIQIPYTMDYFYEKHLEFLDQQERDL